LSEIESNNNAQFQEQSLLWCHHGTAIAKEAANPQHKSSTSTVNFVIITLIIVSQTDISHSFL